MNHLRGPTSAMFFDNWQLGLTTSQAEMDPWQSGAWDVRINYVIKNPRLKCRLQRRTFKPPETFNIHITI